MGVPFSPQPLQHFLFFVLVIIAILMGFSRRVLFPFSCIGSRGFCFLISCPPNWAEISRCLLPTEKCFRRGK
uniref:Beta-defensin-like domain-containing protein n=1 Tax=Equus asinus asinus TaxID=83772 RepID=A0A8C4N2R6_EQUAS